MSNYSADQEKWHEIWERYFPPIKQPQTWIEEMRELENGAEPSNRDLLAAVRWLAREKDRPAYPKLGHLLDALKAYRHWCAEKRREEESPTFSRQTCGVCGGLGTLRFYAALSSDGLICRDTVKIAMGPGDPYLSEMSSPCKCSRGDEMRRRSLAYLPDEFCDSIFRLTIGRDTCKHNAGAK